MKRTFKTLTMCMLACCSLCAEQPAINNDLKYIVQKIFLTDNMAPFYQMIAEQTLEENQVEMDTQTLVDQFMVSFSEEKTLSELAKPYRETFSDEELSELRKIHESAAYQKFTGELGPLFQSNMNTISGLFKDLALRNGTAKTPVAAAAMEETGVVEITKDNYVEQIEQSTVPVIVDVYATWCGPCRKMAPIFEELSQDNPNIRFGKINIDEQGELAAQYKANRLPTILFFKAGKKSPDMRSVGLLSKEEFQQKIDQFAGK